VVGEIYIKEQPNILVSGGTTGLRTWEASLLLSEYLLSLPLQGKSVLELGAGTGLSSIVASKLGAKVLSTDGSEQVIQKLQDNFALNSVEIETGTLWWDEDDEDILHGRQWDFVVGADITYDEDVCSALAETYRLTLQYGGVGILAATIRNENTVKAFVTECGTATLASCFRIFY
jgi:predicted nicotinamide N-methyase